MTTTRDRSVIPSWVPGGLARFGAGGGLDGAVSRGEKRLADIPGQRAGTAPK
jgi:hypothetical protein